MSILSRCISTALCVFALTTPRDAHALDPSRTIAQFHHSRFSIEEGAPGDIRAIVQAADGYLLLAARGGLYRFDGVSFEHLAPPLSTHIDNDQVRNLLALRSGDVLVGYYAGPLAIYRDGRLREFTGPRPLGTPSPMIEDRDGHIWARFSDKLALYAHGRWTIVASVRMGFPAHDIMNFLLARDGTLWIAMRHTIVFIPRGETRIHYTGAVTAGGLGLAQDPSGQIWTTDTMNSVRRVPDYPHGAKASQALLAKSDHMETQNILFDHDGTLWGATSSGIFRIPFRGGDAHAADPLRAAQLFGLPDGLTSDAVLSLFEDREGDIWAGTRMGLDMFRAANIVKPSGMPIVPSGYVIPASGPTVFADEYNLYDIDREGSQRTLLSSGLKLISCICSVRDGSTYVGQVRALSHFKSGVLTDIPVKDKLLFTKCAADGNAVWYTLQNKGIARVENDQVAYFPPPPNYSFDEWSESILAAPMGVVAYFHTRGIVRVDVQPWKTLASEDAIGVGQISSLANGDGLLIGGYRGVARLRDSRIDRLTAEDHPWLGDTQALARAPNGDVWIFSRGGLTRVTAAALEAAFRTPHAPIAHETLDMRDGLPSPATSLIYGYLGVDNEGRIWVSTTEGVAWVDANHLVRNKLAPPVSVRAVIADGRRFGSPRDLSLAAGTNNLEIDYAALSFTEPSRVQFRYKLDGVDSDWVDPGQRRQAFYTRLGPGNYTFHVIASNNDGVWNRTDANLAVTIPPTFIQSNIFITLCALASVALLWLLYTLRLRQVSSRFRILLHERLDERERIARELHDTLLQGFQGLMLHFRSIAERMPADQPERALMGGALDRAEAVLVEGRDRVRNLRSATKHGDIAESLAATGNKFAQGSATRFRITIEGKTRALHAVVRDEVCKIGEEAIFNAFQHARAPKIEVGIVYGRQALSLRVCDDGIGIEPAILAEGREGHFGLLGMRERAEKINAEIKLETRPGAGTEIELIVPANIAYAVTATRRFRDLFSRTSFNQA
jgi:signal transduction histidine kinase/ligand-binding sensor domain-containing protein